MKSMRFREIMRRLVVVVLLCTAMESWAAGEGGSGIGIQAEKSGLATNTERATRYDPNGPNPYKGLSEKELWERKPIIIRGPHEAPTEEESARLKQWTSVLNATAANPYAGKTVKQLLKMKPRMRKVAPWPPKDEEEHRIWQWWHAMRKADPDYEWKVPIEFYGIVVNQSNQPLSDVRVNVQWSAVDGTTPSMSMVTDASGKICVTNILGKGISVMVGKNGYYPFRSAHQGFEYFDIGCLHTPDPTNPVVFRLWEYSNPEPMYKYENVPTVAFSVDDEVVWIDATKGRLSDAGQVGLSVLRKDPTNWLAGYTITIRAAEGGGVKLPEADDELMFQAPEDGYQPQIRIEQAPGNVYSKGKKFRFYLRAPDNKYAAINGDISQYDNRKADMRSCLIYFNPSGSRNLQYLDDLRIREKGALGGIRVSP